jgi:ABC-2 type transport system ATP-binding protein
MNAIGHAEEIKSAGRARTAGNRPAILVEGLTKSYKNVKALKGIDLEVPRGTVLGLLGQNGAGKTTAVRILTTLLKPDGGYAEVVGFNVVKEARALRSHIGLTGQDMALDDHLTGRESLEIVGRLYRLSTREARKRADALLEQFSLSHAAGRTVKTYSGGMRRRLDLAASLIGDPEILFLDEPTTGLDPLSRTSLWEIIEGLVNDGTTLLLTTQYLEEADRLADDIAVVDSGLIIAKGTPEELKDKIGNDILELTMNDTDELTKAISSLSEIRSIGTPQVNSPEKRISISLHEGSHQISGILRALDEDGITVSDIALHRPSLDDVFLTLTGHDTSIPVDNGTMTRSTVDGPVTGTSVAGKSVADGTDTGESIYATPATPIEDARKQDSMGVPNASGVDNLDTTTPIPASDTSSPGTDTSSTGTDTSSTGTDTSSPHSSVSPTRHMFTFTGDFMTIMKRNLLRYIRLPNLIVWNTVQPVMFVLLFTYVFGGIIKFVVHQAYIDFLMPGIFIQAAVFGSTQTGIGISEDMDKGMIDRFKSLPMARMAVLAGRTMSDSVRNVGVVLLMTGVGAILGFRFHNGVGLFIAALALVVAFGLAFSWISAVIGLLAGDPESTQAAGFVWILPLTFASSAFVPVASMPGWLQAFAKADPVTHAVDTLRILLSGGALQVSLIETLAWIVGILIVAIPLAVWLYMRST